MNLIKASLISTLAVSTVTAFSANSSQNTPPPPSTNESTRLQFLQKAFTATAATLAFVPQSSSASSDPFALPSYSEAVKNKSVDMNLEDVNKKIQDDAAAKRDDRNVNKVNNEAYIALKAEEAEEEKRMIRLKEMAKREREERIAAEKAETKANRWNTF